MLIQLSVSSPGQFQIGLVIVMVFMNFIVRFVVTKYNVLRFIVLLAT